MTPGQTLAVIKAHAKSDEEQPRVRKGTIDDLRAHAASVGIRVIDGGKAG